jgi:pimeloyl-ACP methyl ester carboxylesterase
MSADARDRRALPFDVRGAGEPTLLVPRTGFGGGTWGEFGDLLAARRRVIAYARRGFTAAAPDPAHDMRVNADDANSILGLADALPADVVGWSAGGLVALALATEHPDGCRSLVLIEPSVHGLRAITASAVAMTLRSRIAKLRSGQRAATDLSYRWTLAYCGLHRSAWDAMPTAWREAVLAHADAVAAERSHELILRYPSDPQLRALDLPVTLVIGERSPFYFHRIGRHLERLFKRQGARAVTRAAHYQ